MSDMDNQPYDLLGEWDALCHEKPKGIVWSLFKTRLKRRLGNDVVTEWTKTTCTINGTITLTADPGVIPDFIHRDFDVSDPRYIPEHMRTLQRFHTL